MRYLARFFIDDSSGEDQRSLLNTSKFARLMGQSAPIVAPKRKYIITNAQSGTFNITIIKDCVFRVGPHMCYTDADVQLSSANLHQLSGDNFINGHDYAIFAYISPDANANNLAESYTIIDCGKELPKGYTSETCLCIGGFHYGYCASYNTNYDISGTPHLGVLEFSIWTLLHRVAYDSGDIWTNNRGLTYVPPINKWVGIYKGLDATGKFPAFGITPTLITTVPAGSTPYYEVVKYFRGARRWRPCMFDEYIYAGFGSPDITGDNNANAFIASTNSAPTTNGSVVNAVSLYGCKDILGLAYEAYYDPSGFIDKVLCSATTHNSGTNHKVADICWHVKSGFSFRVCADNCY